MNRDYSAGSRRPISWFHLASQDTTSHPLVITERLSHLAFGFIQSKFIEQQQCAQHWEHSREQDAHDLSPHEITISQLASQLYP